MSDLLDHLAHLGPCRYCLHRIYVVICSDGRWRAFNEDEHPAGTPGIWAWRRRVGMQETDVAPGRGLHYCMGWHNGRPLNRDDEPGGLPME